MRVPLSWLREFTEWTGTVAELAAVEAVDNPGQGVRGLVAGRILDVRPHPRLERLAVCEVEGAGRRGVVVSAAPNLAVGATVVWAPPGAVLPAGRVLEERVFGGIASEGMLCAPDEVGLPGGHAGVCVLGPQDLPPRGADVDLAAALHLDDPVLVLELTPNYAAHCQSILGVAREVAALTGGSLHLPTVAQGDAWPAPLVQERVRVAIEAPERCRRYVARAVDGLRPGVAAPLWLRHRVEQCGMRSVQGIVDVTNYVMLELGQPLHAFDLGVVRDGGIVVRRAAEGEVLRTLDGRDRVLGADDLVIADADGPLALAGVMGGERAEVRQDTTAVLIESAVFGADGVARTARRTGIPSEAAARFARGVDPEQARRAADRAVDLLAAHLGGRPWAGAVDVGGAAPAATITLRGVRARSLLGLHLSTSACGRLLERYGFQVQAGGPDRLRVTVPSWRPDVTAEIDLVEEVARAYGYERLPAQLPAGDPDPVPPDPVALAAARARTVALGAGYTEVVPYSYHGRAVWDRMHLPADHPWRQAVALANPMHAEQAVLRTSLAPGLLRVLELNARRRRLDAAVFEVGRVFRVRPGERPAERLVFGAAASGHVQPTGWQYPGEPVDFFALKGLCEEVLSRAGVPVTPLRWEARGDAYPTLHPGRSAEVRAADGTLLGWVGEVHPEVQQAFELRGPTALAELHLDAVAAAAVPRRVVAPSQHPPVRRDLALLVPEGVKAAEVEGALRALAGPLLQECRLFDVFAGPGVPPGRRSLAYALTYQDSRRTLTDAEVDELQRRIEEGLRARLDITLRG
jgi:phenylalanyl-tRNA synthetase beta chain